MNSLLSIWQWQARAVLFCFCALILHPTSVVFAGIQYKEVKELSKTPEKFLIDVRNPIEIAETSSIPFSILIPLPNLETALRLSPEDFQQKYNHVKPNKNDYIIFSCHVGARAKIASEYATNLGFTNVHVYEGSWVDWDQNQYDDMHNA